MFLGIQVRANSQKVWSEAKNGERDWGETPIFFSRLTRPFARARLAQDFEKKTGWFAVYSLNVLYQRWLKINFR